QGGPLHPLPWLISVVGGGHGPSASSVRYSVSARTTSRPTATSFYASRDIYFRARLSSLLADLLRVRDCSFRGPARRQSLSRHRGALGRDTMPNRAAIPFVCPPELLLCPLPGKGPGRYGVKDLRTGECFTLGEQESFLLARLDGTRSAAALCRAVEERFG